MCEHFRSLQAGGGRHVTSGRPRTNSCKDLVSKLHDVAPPSFNTTGSIPSTSHTNVDIQCTICGHTLDRPVELGCGNLVCLECTTRSIFSGCQGCPCCHVTQLPEHYSTPSKVTMTVLGGQLVECTMGCNRTVRADQFQQHLKSKCQGFYEHSTHSPSRTTLSDLLGKDTSTPTTHTEKRVAQHLIKRLMAEAQDSTLLQVPTRGQVFIVYIVTLWTKVNYNLTTSI